MSHSPGPDWRLQVGAVLLMGAVLGVVLALLGVEI
jgi:hypothetical protein